MLKCFYNRIIEIMEVQVLAIFFLNLGEGESDENDDRDFEILLHFEETIVAE